MDISTQLKSFDWAGMPDERWGIRTPVEKDKSSGLATAKASGNTVNDTEPPNFLFEGSPEGYIKLADQAIGALSRSNSPDASKLQKEPFGPITPTHLRVEADLIAPITNYLLTPVQMAINALFDDAFIISHEVSKVGARVDVTFSTYEPKIPTVTPVTYRTVLLVELKRRSLINPGQWRTAIKESNKRMGGWTWDTLDHCCYFMKQAAHYCKAYRQNFVVICDYDSMILLEFWDMDNDHRPNKVDVTIVNTDFRKVLLGFMIKACLAQNLKRQSEYNNIVFKTTRQDFNL
ncbi:hypothetical protein P280DRAFT_540931 [Massarina eburnea CBS 473.64]|uniref:Fungal-type protein kinase domain-containing protein n=1 Tax=Massarina eburnea CBS 473.64 TaxID=1395130 RepID=A0A6A6RGY5_9PLEO|nr:hypothetical protein P280DRAFT_540931 [Massarina eburnea CBS 473.64]